MWLNNKKREWLNLSIGGGVGSSSGGVEGEVVFKNEYQRPPDTIMPFFPQRPIHVLQLKLSISDGTQVSVVFEGDTMGVVEIGDIVTVKGFNRGGNIQATSIFNSSTNSFVVRR